MFTGDVGLSKCQDVLDSLQRNIPLPIRENFAEGPLYNSNRIRLQNVEHNMERFKNRFEIILAVPHLSRKDIEVTVLNDCVVVHAKHDEKYDQHGPVYREFTRRFPIPEYVDQSTLRAVFYRNGYLRIKCQLGAASEMFTPIKMLKPVEEGPSKDIMNSATSPAIYAAEPMANGQASGGTAARQ